MGGADHNQIGLAQKNRVLELHRRRIRHGPAFPQFQLVNALRFLRFPDTPGSSPPPFPPDMPPTNWGIFYRTFASRSADSELDRARTWLTSLSPSSIPRHIGHVSFSRSSGPGGQNVNKSVLLRSPAISAGLTVGAWQGQFQSNLEDPLGYFVTARPASAAP